MELTRFQKILLLVLVGMLLVSSGLMAVLRAHPGVLFEDSLLSITEEDGQTVYSGRVRGTPVTIVVSRPTNFKAVVDFTIGTEIHDVCEVEYPLDSIQTERGDPVSGIRVTKNGETLFEGGFDLDDRSFGWYEASGEWTFWPSAAIQVSGSGSGSWRYYETTAAAAVRFAFGPDTSAHGSPDLFALAAFLSLLLAVGVVFYKELFRLRHWAARDPEPSEGYLVLERVGWVISAVIIAGVYIAALTQIH